jgi:hypothetical protein
VYCEVRSRAILRSWALLRSYALLRSWALLRSLAPLKSWASQYSLAPGSWVFLKLLNSRVFKNITLPKSSRWKELEKTKRMGPISAFYLNLFRTGGQSKMKSQNLQMQIDMDF